MTRLLLAVLLFSVSACHGRQVPVRHSDVVQRPGYAYQWQDDGTVAIAAKSQLHLEQAKTEIGCNRIYICSIKPEGQLYSVTVVKK